MIVQNEQRNDIGQHSKKQEVRLLFTIEPCVIFKYHN